ncbi:MAG TPA: mycothiol system anti-sigma-R factor [Acidimicrobiales bacterium]|nr:mycothiol system anti-sigma-R factor [Acidimicrobiales bacterium]
MSPEGWGSTERGGPGCGCGDAVHRLYHFLDGELDDDRRSTIRRHLDECQPCFQAFGFEAELRVVIARKCQDQVPEALRQRVFHAIQGEAGPFDGPKLPPW